jgi:hypothetical protein
MKLYNHDFSPNAKRVRVATREVGRLQARDSWKKG